MSEPNDQQRHEAHMLRLIEKGKGLIDRGEVMRSTAEILLELPVRDALKIIATIGIENEHWDLVEACCARLQAMPPETDIPTATPPPEVPSSKPTGVDSDGADGKSNEAK